MTLIFDYASDWAWEIQPQGRRFSYFWLVFHIYKGLRQLGLNVDIVPPDSADLSPYKLVLAPGIFTLSDPLKSALAAHKGTAILGPRTNSKTENFSIPVPLPPALPGLDAVVARVESLPPDVTVPLTQGGALINWREKLEGTATVTEVAEDGWPALISSGKLHYLAGWPDEQALTRILHRACLAEGIETDPLPEGLRRRDTATHRFLFNYNPVPAEWGGGHHPPGRGALDKALGLANTLGRRRPAMAGSAVTITILHLTLLGHQRTFRA